jgi:hypothetical protein
MIEVLNKLKIKGDDVKKDNKWHKVLHLLIVLGVR